MRFRARRSGERPHRRERLEGDKESGAVNAETVERVLHVRYRRRPAACRS